jgi:hypothetical protein
MAEHLFDTLSKALARRELSRRGLVKALLSCDSP